MEGVQGGSNISTICQKCHKERLASTVKIVRIPKILPRAVETSYLAQMKGKVEGSTRFSHKVKFNMKLLRSLVSKRTWVISPELKFTYKTLDLRKSKLESVPDNLSRLELLQAIRLDGNEQLEEVSFLGNLPLLRIAAVKNCQLTSLRFSSDVMETIQLRALEVYNNPRLTDFSHLPRLQRLQHLNIGSCNIEILPNELFELRRLRVLVLNDNPLSEPLNDGLSQLTKLQVLLLRNCHLSKIPDPCYQLPQLLFLSVEQNRIPQVPMTLCMLESLQVLSIYGNRGIQLSTKLARCPNLKRINVDLKFSQKILPKRLERIVNVWKDTPCAWWKQL